MRSVLYVLAMLGLLSCTNTQAPNPVEQQTRILDFTERDQAFLQLINAEVVVDASEKRFISDITQLVPIKLLSCDSMHIHYRDVLDGYTVEFKMSLQRFQEGDHEISIHDVDSTGGQVTWIDGREPWGATYQLPLTEIKVVEMTVNGRSVALQDKLSDLYDLDMCDDLLYSDYFSPSPLLTYDANNQLFYLYISAGNAANTCFGKYILSKQGYVTRYMLHYGQLSETSSFRPNFKGF